MITLYTSRTGNGYRISILLEELNLAYEAITVDVRIGASRPEPFLDASPLGKIPAIVDTDTPDGVPICVAESLAIALYLVEKTGKLQPASIEERVRAWQWSSIVVSGFGSAIPGVFFARMLGAEDHARLIEKYRADIEGYFGAMDAHLARHRYLAGAQFSYADALAAPLITTGRAFEFDLTRFSSLLRWESEVFAREGVKKGMAVPA